MKKRNLLLALVMSVVMLFTACGSSEPNPLVGKWVGTLDLTSYIIDAMVEEDATMEEYLKFENLTFTFVFEFTEDEISLCLDKASTTQFIENVEAGITTMVDTMVVDMADEYSMTEEDIYAAMGLTRDEFVQTMLDSMHLDTMISAMSEALELSGTYVYDEENITVYYEDNTYEDMKYTLDGDVLAITVTDGTNEFVINCTKEAE